MNLLSKLIFFKVIVSFLSFYGDTHCLYTISSHQVTVKQLSTQKDFGLMNNPNQYDKKSLKDGIIYYRFPIYDPKIKRYRFDYRFSIKNSIISKYSYYYEVFYKNFIISQVNYYYLSTITEKYFYEYSKNGLVIRGYDENEKLFFLQKYNSKDKLIFFEIYNVRHQKTYQIKDKILKNKGIENCFYPKSIFLDKIGSFNSLQKTSYHCVQLNLHKQILISKEYKYGILDRRLNYEYDDQHRLKREYIHHIQKRYKEKTEFFYGQGQKEFLLIEKKTYRGSFIFSHVYYDDNGKIRLKKDYFPYTQRIQNKIYYHYTKKGIKTLKYYDFQNQLYLEERYDENDRLLKEIHYPSNIFNIKEKKEYWYKYKVLKKSKRLEIYRYQKKKIERKIIKDLENQLLEKLIWKPNGDQYRYLYTYNQDGRLVRIFIYNHLKLIEKREYFYQHKNQNRLKLIEFYQVKNHKIQKKLSEYYEYYPNGYLKQLKIFENNHLVELKILDFRSRVIKVEYGSSGDYHSMLKHSYDAKDCLIESIRYNKVDQIEGYIHYKYNEFNLKIRQDLYDNGKKYLGSVHYEYSPMMTLIKKIYYDGEGKIYKEEKIKS